CLLADCFSNSFCPVLGLLQCFSLHHDPDQRLCSGSAQQNTSIVSQCLFCFVFTGFNRWVAPKIKISGNLHIDQTLRKKGDITHKISQRQTSITQCIQNLESRNNAIPCRMFVSANNVTGVLSAHIPVILLQQLGNIAISDICSGKWNPKSTECLLDRQIGQKGSEYPAQQHITQLPMFSNDINQAVAIVQYSLFADHQYTISIAIHSKPD